MPTTITQEHSLARNKPAPAEFPFEISKRFVHPPVRSCEEAAAGRGIDLHKELKSIIIKSGDEFVAVHLRADHRLNNKALKEFLQERRQRFASTDELAVFGLSCGRINPANTTFCSRHLVDEAVFELDFVATNDGTFTGGVAFAPHQLRRLNNLTVGRFANA